MADTMAPAMALRLARHIADRATKLLEDRGIIAGERRRGPAFYVWPRPDRVVLIFDPLALKDVERALDRRLIHHLTAALGGRRIVCTNSRGVYLQIAYWPAPARTLESRPLDLSQQPGPLYLFSAPL